MSEAEYRTYMLTHLSRTKGCQAWLIEGPGGVVEVNLNHEKKKGGK